MTDTEPDRGPTGRGSPLTLAVTVVLIVGGAILLAIGWARDSLGVIYASVVCSALAGVAVIVLSRLSRRRAVRAAAAGLGPRPGTGAPEPPGPTGPAGSSGAPGPGAGPVGDLPSDVPGPPRPPAGST